jgi:hypothetical protein
MFVNKENGIIVESWSSAQTDAQRALGEAHPDWLPDDHPEAVARLAGPVPAAAPSIPNWKAHGILTMDGKRQAVLDLIGAIGDPAKRELVLSAFLRLDPIPRDSATLVELLTHPAVGYDEAGIDDLFERGNALRIDRD